MKYYFIAGEASGDLHGANLIAALKQKDAVSEFRAWGGDKMQNQGAEIVKHYKHLAFMGFWEVAKNLRTILSNIAFCKKDIIAFKPDALVLIDYPGFNMRIAKWATALGIPVHYYIMPQVWAWKENRVRKLAKHTNYRYGILPFEVDFFQKKHKLPIDFVGHPLIDELSAIPKSYSTSLRVALGLTKNEKIIALLPGSRKQEISKILGVITTIIDSFPDYRFVIAGTSNIDRSLYHQLAPDVDIVIDQTYDLIRLADAAIVTSGTATLETALLKTPQIVCYKTSPLSFAIAKRIVKLPFISLVNLVVNRLLVRELIQSECNQTKLTNSLQEILSKNGRKAILSGYDELIEKLGGKGASEKVASLIHRRTHA
jgi:lipid-A-disaccharide synthase